MYLGILHIFQCQIASVSQAAKSQAANQIGSAAIASGLRADVDRHVGRVLCAIIVVAASVLTPMTGLAALSGNGTDSSPYDDGTWNVFVVSARPLSSYASPVDEYFGHERQSILGIRNLIYDMRIRPKAESGRRRLIGRIERVRSALVDWADKYPNDPWIPNLMFTFVRELREQHQTATDLVAVSLLYYMSERYVGEAWAGWSEQILRVIRITPQLDVGAITSMLNPESP